jgi:UDP-N-acetylglucosamine 4,6-dehydratase/5-epimerase
MDLNGKTLLITGATGSFGRAFMRTVLDRYDVEAVRVFSRDELKQSELERTFHDDRLRLLLGDVRDRDRLRLATRGVDVIVHAAALKQVPACEYNPFEAVQTNVIGAENVISAAIDNHVPLTIALSTDKAVNPANLYGATKLCAEKIVAQANVYAGGGPSRFASVRYGNVVSSRGSVIPIFKAQAETGVVTITDERMTRFWITLEQAVQFVLDALGRMGGGEIFVPKIPSMRVVDLARLIGPDCRQEIVGIRPGEKLHEVMCPADDSHLTLEFADHYVITPAIQFSGRADFSNNQLGEKGRPVEQGFEFHSGRNPHFLSIEEIVAMNNYSGVE